MFLHGKTYVSNNFRLEEGEYMGFGLSGDNERTKMVGGDVTVAWMDHASGKSITAYFTGLLR